MASALALAGALAACSGGSANIEQEEAGGASALQVAGLLGQALRQRRAEPETFSLTRADLATAGFTQPLLLARLESGVTAGLTPAASNRGYITWQTQDGIALIGRGDVLAGTRGLGADLLSAETEPVLLALAAGRGDRYRRALRRLDGEGRILVQDYRCELTLGPAETVVVLGRAHATRRSTETCRPVAESDPETPAAYRAEPFVNTYNVGDGTIWRSRQWIGPAVGYLVLERVIE
jgi:hypothetical protein